MKTIRFIFISIAILSILNVFLQYKQHELHRIERIWNNDIFYMQQEQFYLMKGLYHLSNTKYIYKIEIMKLEKKK